MLQSIWLVKIFSFFRYFSFDQFPSQYAVGLPRVVCFVFLFVPFPLLTVFFQVAVEGFAVSLFSGIGIFV